jgi:hypothetical protein
MPVGPEFYFSSKLSGKFLSHAYEFADDNSFIVDFKAYLIRVRSDALERNRVYVSLDRIEQFEKRD